MSILLETELENNEYVRNVINKYYQLLEDKKVEPQSIENKIYYKHSETERILFEYQRLLYETEKEPALLLKYNEILKRIKELIEISRIDKQVINEIKESIFVLSILFGITSRLYSSVPNIHKRINENNSLSK